MVQEIAAMEKINESYVNRCRDWLPGVGDRGGDIGWEAGKVCACRPSTRDVERCPGETARLCKGW